MEKDKVFFLVLVLVLLVGGLAIDLFFRSIFYLIDRDSVRLCGFHALRYHSQNAAWVLDENHCDECRKFKEES